MAPTLRPALPSDEAQLHRFLAAPNYAHRHLDWRDAFEWLGQAPFYVLEEDGQIVGALSCIAEPEEVAWVRLFACTARSSPDRMWDQLFACVPQALRKAPTPPAIVSLALREWYEELLKRKGFRHHQDIVVFIFDEEPPAPVELDSSIHLRAMVEEDLPQVYRIDHQAFEPIWRLSRDDLRFALEKSTYCTVAARGETVIGYSMSSSSGTYAHLARLAVDPNVQGQRVGFGLVQDLLEEFITRRDHWGVTLNTQHDNHASLALYHKVGFRETGERFPVYLYPD